MNHATKSFATLDASAAPFLYCWTYRLGRSEGQRPVRPMAVVVIKEDAKDIRGCHQSCQGQQKSSAPFGALWKRDLD